MKGLKAAAVMPIVLASLAIQAQDKPSLVQGSDKHDFSIRCEKGGKVTLEVFDLNEVDSLRIARNIYVADQGDGRRLITYNHGFILAKEQATYVTATDESCAFSRRLI
ncbi:hypothetical protein F3I62_17495 [Pseudomonas sp. R-28-1W-6]|jgi:hypothetical protein|uniref:hypothetical protein n=1 Tax=Pseudomonas sp. R-28-1W-6 TaxID=2650101 RepID=UPI0013657832|nr:hypothetical protein [Pseudomonas sp. R-28-1W-6]MWV13897.1 hypothetical protein [Pseudomonas sp. R-28-1W-6]